MMTKNRACAYWSPKQAGMEREEEKTVDLRSFNFNKNNKSKRYLTRLFCYVALGFLVQLFPL